MQIKMKETAKGSNDGIEVKSYLKGETYTVGEDLGNSFLKSNLAEIPGAEEPKAEKKKYSRGK